MPAELIGLARCPVPSCGSDRARLTLAKNGLSVITCNACNFQGFSRSDRSDTGLRSLLTTVQKPPMPKTPIAAAVEQVSEPAPASRGMGWGVLGALS